MEFYSPGFAVCLTLISIGSIKVDIHVHRMWGTRSPEYVMVRVNSGPSRSQSEWIIPGTLDVNS